ncbi:hypothetical protein [Corynebacterium mastitidis]|uniref:hypothetical protein n=1 Tax=Corynebacterium mastitidis TaxID=161890 RepID=UPI00254E239A|nr:hypothetical protein [Corynebacterium mastitidis]MDK8450182.1 hypothetical protein [Corynebacterium mastitidis]
MFSRKNLAAAAASAVIATGVVAAPAFAEEPVDPDYSVTETKDIKDEGSSDFDFSELSSEDEAKGDSEGSVSGDTLSFLGKAIEFIKGLLG